MKKLFIIAALAISFSLSQAQSLVEFSQDTGKFISELDVAFGSLLTEAEIVVCESFKINWEVLDIQSQNEIMELCELMRVRGFKPKPHFIKLLLILNEFHGEGKTDHGYADWVKGYRSLLQSEGLVLKDMNSFQNNSMQMLKGNVLYKSRGASWMLKEPNYSFKFQDSLFIQITSGDLYCSDKRDTINIYDADGRVDILRQKFIGTKGTVYWEKAEFEPENTFAILSDYVLNLNEAGYKAENVELTHKNLFDQPIAGHIEDRISFAKNAAQAKYPKFITYQSSYVLKNFIPGVSFSGGISMQGAHIAGLGMDGEDALIEISSDDTLRARLSSSIFLINSSAIHANHAEVSIYIEDDSIYHPDVIMNYSISKEYLRLTKSKDYNSQGPYTNSYHMIDMNFAELRWERTGSDMKFQAAMGTAMGNAWFESYDFFNDAVYNSLQNILEYTNPLADLWSFAELLNSRVFAVLSFAYHMGTDPSNERHRLMNLSRLGFIYFDFENDEIIVRDKLYDYIDAHHKQRDYDVIRFKSNTSSGLENASLDLKTKDLTINGIPNIFLSDSQEVRLVPTDNKIIMKRNRNFQFDGIIDAGLFKFYGQNFFFEYDSFLINLQNIDSLSISAKTEERDISGANLLVNIENKIENITGELLIDFPFNKSGLENYPDYPIFTSRERSYIYFDEKTIQDGLYDRERFYFELDPFTIDSLDNFTRNAMRMKGTFVSASIMPPMQMEMSLRPDNSLGFYLTTPDEGLPLFDGKATFYNDIEMSNKGLHGYGSMDYITSTTWSDDFLFHPDSITTTSREFLERAKSEMTSYPLVKNSIAKITFIPDSDLMNIKGMEEPFEMFADNTIFEGNLTLRPSGLSGNGALGLPDGLIESRKMNFEINRIYADSAGVKIRPGIESDFTLITDNVAIDVDLSKREGSLIAIEDFTLISFPSNLYETRLDQLDWFMDRNEIRLSQNKPLKEDKTDLEVDSMSVSGPSYISLHIDQDSLNFVAPLALFNYQDKLIQAKEVLYIEVGDSYVFPAGGDVEIKELAAMSPLNMAKILTNTSSRYHNLYDAHVEIDSRLHYTGSGMYDYVDEFGTVYPFLFDDIEVSRKIETLGTGHIAVDESFMISPYMEYMGEIRLNAKNPLLTFSGGVRLTHTCDINKQWMRFESRINPDSILIPVVRNMQNYALNKISASPMIAKDSTHLYPAFLSKRKGPYDKNVITPTGYLFYDKENEYYEIASEAKLDDMKSKGNYLRLETDSCILYGEGLLDMKLSFGRFKMKTAGNVTHHVEKDELEMHMLMGLNFFFNEEALQIFGNEIDSIVDLEPVDLTSPFYTLAMKNMVGEELADKLETDLGLYGTYTEIPEELDYSILLNDVFLKWNQETNSFRYNGKVGIGMIGGIQINKKVDAYIELVDKGADIIDIYLKADSRTWYYIAYGNGVLQALSSNQEFNNILIDLKTKKRKLKTKRGEAAYIYSEASPQRLGRFIRKFEYTEERIGAEEF